jgi:hypothetical protein
MSRTKSGARSIRDATVERDPHDGDVVTLDVLQSGKSSKGTKARVTRNLEPVDLADDRRSNVAVGRFVSLRHDLSLYFVGDISVNAVMEYRLFDVEVVAVSP